ncbi:hypothetical protein [Streptomyces sp. DHE17-7]|uniref:hypothetical protein n=1 Tax=Streptomyces sp. DHE17-7 TaxID=2759949 RepID=UPI000ECE1A8F|nr:hypothetical protein [Streptomyces sp. DHE17-7]MBJ6623495.1 hypothetical protein [Streptomyces sp. DHE17-7]RIH58756.1 hypothetical protein D3C59_32980 [Streptomyces sp. SHP22-7]RIH59112.1 hypothetical protein D3C59_30075 [Streptomyces sp. SHP22-7]
MTTPVRARRRSLRSRLISYISDAITRIRSAWRILITAQSQLLLRLSRVRPGARAQARIREAIQEFQQAIATFYREAGAFADRWASVDLPLVYREGAYTMLDNARRPGVRFSWTLRHQQQVTALSAQYYADLTARISEALRRARVFLRAAQDAVRSRTRFDSAQLRRDHPLDAVVYANNARHPVDSWASAAITWQAVSTANSGAAQTALQELGTEWVEVRDGHDCGWTTHGDEDKANRTLRTVQDALAHPTSHPHCIREFLPRLDLIGRTEIRTGAPL